MVGHDSHRQGSRALTQARVAIRPASNSLLPSGPVPLAPVAASSSSRAAPVAAAARALKVAPGLERHNVCHDKEAHVAANIAGWFY